MICSYGSRKVKSLKFQKCTTQHNKLLIFFIYKGHQLVESIINMMSTCSYGSRKVKSLKFQKCTTQQNKLLIFFIYKGHQLVGSIINMMSTCSRRCHYLLQAHSPLFFISKYGNSSLLALME